MTKEILVSVIIPSHNRRVSLRRTLDALGKQTFPLEKFEVLIVEDGCTDDTPEMLRQHEAPFHLRTLQQSHRGAAEARNRGAAHASGELLVFLDDDVEAGPFLIEAHVRAHEQRPGTVVIGYLPPILGPSRSFLAMGLRGWWESTFQGMRDPGHRYTYRDVMTGNVSIEKELFRKIGGFDTSFLCHEDFELGIRLIKAGIPLIFVEEAVGYHHETVDHARSFQRKYQEGKADVMLGLRHPDIRPVLPLARFKSTFPFSKRFVRTLAFRWPAAGSFFITFCRFGLRLLERAKMRSHWRRLFLGMVTYFYWRGVADEVGGEKELRSFLQPEALMNEGDNSEIEIDIREGLEAAERRLDEERPDALRLRYGQQIVGRVPPQPGSEPFRANHLRALLGADFAEPLLKAVAMEAATHRLEEAEAPSPLSVIPPGKVHAQ